MHGRRSLRKNLAPVFDNIHRRSVLLAANLEGENNIARNLELELLENKSHASDTESEKEDEPKRIEGVKRDSDMAARQMKELARLIIGAAASPIVLGQAARNYELKNIYFNQLPSFYGMPAEDALNFIREFYAIVQTFPLGGLNEDQLKMRCFPYTLKDRAKLWFMSLSANSLQNWNQVFEKFMAKWYPNQKTQEVRSQLVNFSQMEGEPFHEAWERFKGLQLQCPHHNFPAELLNQFFYESLHQNFQYMVDNAAGGDIGSQTAEQLTRIFESMTENSQQKSTRGMKNIVNKVTPNHDLVKQLAELTRQVEAIRTTDEQSRRSIVKETCGICGEYGHGANVCAHAVESMLEYEEQVNALQGFQPRPKFDPYSNTYNPGYHYHPNFSWKQNSQPQQNVQPQNTFQQFSQPQQAPPKASLEDNLNKFIQASHQRFKTVEASMKRIETQVGQLAGTLGELVQQN